MSDKQTAAIVLGFIAVAFLLWYRRQSEGARSALFGGAGGGMTPSPGRAATAPAGGPPVLPRVLGIDPRLITFARDNGLLITSGTGGTHNPGSAHYQGRAIDVRSRGLLDTVVAQIKALAAAAGIRLRDERQRPAGQAVWGGPHLHLQVDR